MLSTFGIGPAVDGMGLFHALGSYCGSFNISVSACREMIPDPAFYAQCLTDSFNETLSAAKAKKPVKKASKIVGTKTAAKTTKKKTTKKRATKKKT